jgi:hypothetical protein
MAEPAAWALSEDCANGVALAEAPGRGRCLLARQPFKPGQLVRCPPRAPPQSTAMPAAGRVATDENSTTYMRIGRSVRPALLVSPSSAEQCRQPFSDRSTTPSRPPHSHGRPAMTNHTLFLFSLT